MHIIRVLAKLEPGGAQLAILRLTRELRHRHDVSTTLLVGDATPDGILLAERHGVSPVVMRTNVKARRTGDLQWQLSERFAGWLADTVRGADLVHAHMVGAWWAVAQVIDPETLFLATEHNQVNWPARRISSLRPLAGRIDRFYAMGPSARRFAVAAGVRTDVITSARSPVSGLRATPGPGLKQPRVTFAGRLSEDKGADVLVEAMALLARQDVTCYVLGDGPMRTRLTDRVRRLGIADRVVMPGWVDDPWRYVAGSAVHVVPSREEAWSQSAVLGLGLGVPVVGTAVDGLVETLADSRGVLVVPDNPHVLSYAISSALAGPNGSDRAGGISYARQFTPSRVASFYVAEYSRLSAERAERVGRLAAVR